MQEKKENTVLGEQTKEQKDSGVADKRAVRTAEQAHDWATWRNRVAAPDEKIKLTVGSAFCGALSHGAGVRVLDAATLALVKIIPVGPPVWWNGGDAGSAV